MSDPTLYYNGTIVTLDPNQPRASVMLVEDGVIRFVGDDADVAPSGCQRVDLEDATVVPGFNDCHMHILSMGLGLQQMDVRPEVAPAITDIVRVVGARAQTAPAGTWLLGRGYNQNLLVEGRHPTRYDLDAVSRDHPVAIWHTSGHVIVANSIALSLAGIGSSTADPEGGEFERDQTGEPTGVLKENGMGMVRRALPPITETIGRDAILAASRVLASEGIASASDAATGQHQNCVAEAAMYRAALESGDLATRMVLMPVIEQVTGGNAVRPADLPVGSTPRWMKIGHTKVFTDGALTTRTAAMREPYEDGSGTGILTWDQADLAQRCREAVEAGWQIACHAIGDRAIQQVLDNYRELPDSNDSRPRIEHATICDHTQIEQIKRSNVTVVLQPEDIAVLGDAYPPALGSFRASNNSPVGWFRSHEVPIAFSSDRPVTPGNPLVGIRAAVERLTACGGNLGSAEHGVTAEEAIGYYARGAAFATGDEGWKGTLAAGQAADFAVLDRDITGCAPDEVAQTRVLRTVVDGNTVFSL